jgi:hypothetical protein
MRSFSCGLAINLALAGLAPATAASDADALRRFGMLGRLAVDCSAPHSQSNPHQVYAVSPSGAVTRSMRMDNPALDATLPLRNVRMLTSDLLQFEELGRASTLTVSIIKIDGRFRNWNSTQANGVALIVDGKFTDSGRPTTAFTFCGN